MHVLFQISACEHCQKEDRIKTVAPELKPIETERPWEKVGIDLMGKLPETESGYEYILSVTCLFSKWVELYPLRRKAGPDVAAQLQRFIMRHSAPKIFISDQGREFTNEVFFKIKLIRLTKISQYSKIMEFIT